MIKLTRERDGSALYITPQHVKAVCKDYLSLFTSGQGTQVYVLGDYFVVNESPEEVAELVIAAKQNDMKLQMSYLHQIKEKE